MANRDIRIDVYSDSSPNIIVRITDKITGACVSGEGVSRHKIEKELLPILDKEVKRIESEMHKNE